MPIETYVEDGQLVGYLPSIGATARVPLREIMRDARANLSPAELNMLDTMSGDTVGGIVDDVVGGKIARKLKKGIKKIAKSKIVKALVKVVKKAIPPPFNVAVSAAAGAAKFATALAKGKKKTKKKAKAMVPAIRAAAAGRISSKQLTAKARKVGVKPSIAADAAVMKRVALQARTNPQAAATMRLSKDLTSTKPADQVRAVEALEASDYQEPTTSRDDGQGEGMTPPDAYEAEGAEEQAPMTEDSVGPDEVEPFEADEGAAFDGETPSESDSVEGYGYW